MFRFEECRLAASTAKRCCLINSVRHLRRKAPPPGKPPIVPPAKKVLYNVIQREWTSPADVEQLLWRRHVYNNVMQSLRKVFAEEIRQKEKQGLGIENLRVKEAEELNFLIAENDKQNRERAAERDKRIEMQQQELRERYLAEINEELQKQATLTKEKSIEVDEMIKRSANFITRDNLEQRINEALEHPVVFDHAIDFEGSKFADPPPVKYMTGTPTRQKARLYDR